MSETGARILLEGTHNTRDLGGIPTKDGRHIRPGFFLRTDALMHLTPEDVLTLVKDYRPALDVDFRGPAEIRREGEDKAIPGCRKVSLPITWDDSVRKSYPHPEYRIPDPEIQGLYDYLFWISPVGDAHLGMQGSYRDFVRCKKGQEGYAVFLDLVLKEGDKGAVLYHCADGKDRAGVATYLLLSALGVGEEEILKDYLRTQENVKAIKEKRRDYLLNVVHMGDRTDLVDSLALLAGVDESWLKAAMDEVRRMGGIEAYLSKNLNFGPEKQKALRDRCLS